MTASLSHHEFDRPGPRPRTPRRRFRGRRGTVKGGVILCLLGGGVLGGTAIAVRPRTIGASVSIEATVGAERAAAMETLAGIVRRSVEVVAVHHRPGAPFTDVVIHAFDGPRRGQLEPTEVLVLTHSRTLRAVMAYTLDPSVADPERVHRPIERSVITDPGFARSWRDRADVRRDIVPAGAGLVALDLEPPERPGNSDGSSWVLRLTWADGSADGSVTAEVRVDLAVGGP